jgi:hypothetical protein
LNSLVNFRLVRIFHPLLEHRILHLALCPIFGGHYKTFVTPEIGVIRSIPHDAYSHLQIVYSPEAFLWSWDGQHVAVYGDGKVNIFGLDGTRHAEFGDINRGFHSFGQWMDDSRSILLLRTMEGDPQKYELIHYTLASRTINVLYTGVSHIVPSLDGRYVAFFQTIGDRMAAHIWDSQTETFRALIEDIGVWIPPSQPNQQRLFWSADSQRVTIIGDDLISIRVDGLERQRWAMPHVRYQHQAWYNDPRLYFHVPPDEENAGWGGVFNLDTGRLTPLYTNNAESSMFIMVGTQNQSGHHARYWYDGQAHSYLSLYSPIGQHLFDYAVDHLMTNGYLPHLAMSPDSTMLLIGGDLIDVQTGNAVRDFAFGWHPVSWSPDSAFVATIGGKANGTPSEAAYQLNIFDVRGVMNWQGNRWGNRLTEIDMSLYPRWDRCSDAFRLFGVE